jgi:hypothetical protein
MLLESPTASGKTLTVGRALEGLRGELPRKCIWFWFTPYTGLVAQTRETLNRQCSGLRLRDVYKDREPTGTRDGDVFVQTWAAVAARNKEARTIRRTKEDTLSLDDLIADLRADDAFASVFFVELHHCLRSCRRTCKEVEDELARTNSCLEQRTHERARFGIIENLASEYFLNLAGRGTRSSCMLPTEVAHEGGALAALAISRRCGLNGKNSRAG